jgi:hypothetical protein
MVRLERRDPEPFRVRKADRPPELIARIAKRADARAGA